MFTFAAAVFFLIISPGPGVLTTAGIAAGFGPRPAARFVLGLFIGGNLVSLAVITGLAALIFANNWVRTVLMAISICYLLYLAFRVATAGSKIAFMERAAPPGVRGGLALQLVNPKAYVVSTSLFSAFPFYPDSYLIEVAIKLVVFNLIWTPIHFLWLFAGIWLNRLDLSDGSQRLINYSMAMAMLIVVALATLSPSIT